MKRGTHSKYWINSKSENADTTGLEILSLNPNNATAMHGWETKGQNMGMGVNVSDSSKSLQSLRSHMWKWADFL